MATVSEHRGERADLLTHRGRRTQAVIDGAARPVIARESILPTIAEIATEAGRSTASFYNYYSGAGSSRLRQEVG